MKLIKLHIDNFKLFKDFDIDFTDSEDKPLPIAILAGINGSGKTTILEAINNSSDFHQRSKNESSLSILYKGKLEDDQKVVDRIVRMGDEKILYFPANIDIEDIKNFLPEYLFEKIFTKKHDVEESYREVREYINKIFKDIDIQIEFDSRDGKGNLFFRNQKGEIFSIDEISTGEKTLLSKVLYLYLKKIKDKVILIDEPELSLHPSWQNRILKLYEDFAEKNGCQIIIATHSPHIIGSAKSEYIKLLVEKENKIEVVDNLDRSYGLEFDKILTQIMGVENLRTPDVAKDIKRLWELLKVEDYESSEYKELYSKLEDLLGDLDEDMVLSRLEIARIKSRDVKSK